ncbi:FecR domain-containing protein [Xenophilus sp.]|uniref:FecR family protein n=1 Tax=Xenophilus sp. TaxID=1873499 RepID=UPI0037DCE8A8
MTAGRARAAPAVLCLLLMLGATDAAARGAEGYVEHRVEPGDTLPSIARRYLRQPERWRALQRPNGVKDPQALPAGSTVRIPARLLRPGAVAARVEFVRGQALVTPAGADAPEPAAPGARLAEGARIEVPQDGYLSLRLADGSVVRVLAGSDVELKRLRRRNGATSFESVLGVRRGKVESEVAPQPRGRVFEIQAPGAVASVRGTRFDVSVGADGQVGTAVTQGEVALRAARPVHRNSRRLMRVGAGQGAVVQADGQLGAQRPLPAAPDLSTAADRYEDAGGLAVDLGPAARGDYEVRLAREADFAEVLRDGVARGGRVRFAPLEDGVYVLGVRALDADGLAGPESRRTVHVDAQPVPPLYRFPAPGARVAAEGARLLCSPVADAQWVHLQVSRRADFAVPEIDEPRLAHCELGLSALPAGDYHWRVASVRRDAQGRPDQGPFAPAVPFTLVDVAAPSSLQLAEDGERPTLHWVAQPGLAYEAQLAADPAFGHILASAQGLEARWTLPALPRGAYFVRLRAREPGGAAGPFTAARRVHVGGIVRSGSGEALRSADGEPVAQP